jgi:cell wall-associated NlpC family hydrolase
MSPLKLLAAGGLAVAICFLGVGAVAIAVVMVVLGALGGATPPSAAASTSVPPAMLALYQRAAAADCPAMPWQIVAAIGTVESDNGQSTLPGVQSGANSAGAEGPMQFLPATFAAYDLPVPAGGVAPPSIYDPVDAVYAAARMLCADGGGTGNYPQAIFAYNHSQAYVDQVLATAVSYGMAADGSTGSGFPPASVIDPGPGRTWPGSPAAAIAFALSQVGVPYVWGGDTPGLGLDCSGLVQVSYRAAGIALPRTTFAQVTYGTTVPLGQLAPGDLLFFRGGEPITDFGHVGIYLGNGTMVDAPHTGADVEVTSVNLDSVEVARRILTGSATVES